jgi:hypothetical protein
MLASALYRQHAFEQAYAEFGRANALEPRLGAPEALLPRLTSAGDVADHIAGLGGIAGISGDVLSQPSVAAPPGAVNSGAPPARPGATPPEPTPATAADEAATAGAAQPAGVVVATLPTDRAGADKPGADTPADSADPTASKPQVGGKRGRKPRVPKAERGERPGFFARLFHWGR